MSAALIQAYKREVAKLQPLLAKYGTEKTFRSQATIITHGQPVGGLHLIISGQASIHLMHDAKPPTLVNCVGPGEILGHSFFSKAPTMFKVIAESETQTLWLDNPAYEMLKKQEPASLLPLLEVMSGLLYERYKTLLLAGI